MSDKVKVNLTMSREVVEKAKKIGLNISQFCENALKEAIRRLEQPKTETDGNGSFLGTASFTKEGVVDGTGFEPVTSTMPTSRSFQADLPAQKQPMPRNY